MAGKKDNLKSLFSNTRSRVVILFTVLLLVVSVIIGYVKFSSSTESAVLSGSVGSGPVNIRSIPGSSNQTAQYAALQETQNIQQAQQARQKGLSSIPTIIRTQAFGQGVQIIGQKPGEGGVDFSGLSILESSAGTKNAWIQSLKDANCSGSALNNAIVLGAALSDLKSVCGCEQLKKGGYKVAQLEPVCSCAELKSAGFDIVQLKDAGFSAERLRLCGYVACDEKGVGFTAQQMKDAGFSDGELKGAGFSERDIARADGLPDGFTAEDVRNAGCSVAGLNKLRAAGVSAAAIRRISGCSAANLKAAGFSAENLKNAGFTAADLKNAGFSPSELKQAGYDARALLNAGFNGDDLAKAGFTAGQIKAAEAVLPFGLTPDDIKKAGCSVEALKRERLAGVSANLIHKYANCSLQALHQANFNNDDLLNAGFTPAEVNALPAVGTRQLSNGASDAAIKKAGCDAGKLKVLLAQGITAKQIHDVNGCSADALKKAGFDAKSLSDAGFTPDELLKAGFSPQDLIQAGLSPTAVIAAGRTADCSLASLKAAHNLGVSAATIESTLGCSAKALMNAGFSAADLKNAGFTAADLKNAGFSLAQLKDAGYSAKELRASGWTASDLKNAGFNVQQLKDAGFNATDLQKVGFSAAQLKTAGFSAKQLKAAGFSAADLKSAGFSAKALKSAGFGAADLRKAGFSATDLKNAGFDSDELKNAGYSNQALSDAGFSNVAGLDTISPLSPQTPSPTTIPSLTETKGTTSALAAQEAATKHLNDIRTQQEKQVAAQRFQQKIQQRQAVMLAAANQSLQGWKLSPQQAYIAGSAKAGAVKTEDFMGHSTVNPGFQGGHKKITSTQDSNSLIVVKTGDILFAVIDTSVNTDEPGPILATIVSGRLKGSKLIGSFRLPANADKLILTFNTLSIPGENKTVSINAYAVDPNTARTALASQVNHHYLSRYGALFASTFIEGFGNAFQSANTTITIGGTGGTTDTTVQNGIGRSTLENAVIGLATVGKAWGKVASQNMNRPTTIQLYSGTGVGVLFTQDLKVTS